MDWETMESILFSLDKIIFIIYFLILSMVMLVEGKVTSFVITLVVLTLANGAMTSIVPSLYQYAVKPGLWTKFAWYASFAVIDTLAVFLLFKFHKLLKQSVGFIANIVGALFVLFATLQTVRFIDRFVFEAEAFQLIYQYAIPFINMAIVPVLILVWLFDYGSRQKKIRQAVII
ncbi:hypothetical protein E0Z06_04730 [Rheinheimera sp. D18]|uniref:hypothetical protein n=1 Tax=Rheinheimera sp. D18 TaxID=2545632 RepID=UPI001052EBD6|nr:hypothetical protein [Rheinheimera sp. D18]QBL08864.1 hypothetical protein E0Z06_04730 [Rheinheimera sp. D18]